MRWCATVNDDLEVLAAPALTTRYETLVRVSRAVAAYRDPKDLLGILMDELQGMVQFDFVGVYLRDQNSDTFQNYFIDVAGRSALVPEEQLTPEETLTSGVFEHQGTFLGAANEIEPRHNPLQTVLKTPSVRSVPPIS